MKKTTLYLLAAALAALGIAGFLWKWKVLNFPVTPVAQTEVWEIQARVEYDAPRGPSRVVLQLPNDPQSINSRKYSTQSALSKTRCLEYYS